MLRKEGIRRGEAKKEIQLGRQGEGLRELECKQRVEVGNSNHHPSPAEIGGLGINRKDVQFLEERRDGSQWTKTGRRKVDVCETKMYGKAETGGKERGGWKKRIQCMYMSMSFQNSKV